MGGAESVVRNVDKRTSRREHRATFEAAVSRFRADPFAAPPCTAVAQLASNLRVCIRKRPFFAHEYEQGEFDVISCLRGRVIVHDARMKPDMRNMFLNHHDFTYNEVFDEMVGNDDVYARSAQEIVQAAAVGGHGTVMMYGQTGSGKTYTMSFFYKQAAEELFEHVTSKVVTVYFIELLGDKCFDMLNGGAPCRLVSAPDGSVHPMGCVEVDVANASELLSLINMAGKLRATAATGVHDQSSRSHALCRIFVRESAEEGSCIDEGSLTLVDLAGTEHRIDNAEHNPERQKEGAKINASLAALKDCIRATAAGAKFVAFRQNRLTQLLRGCFAGTRPHPTIVIATISPSSKDTEHSLNTLRHACIMDGQGQCKAAQSAHVTGGVITKELLGEIDVTRIAREKQRRSPRLPDSRLGELRKPMPAHQAKQSNTVKRASLDRRCSQALPPGVADKLAAARAGFGNERQRARLRPKEECGADDEPEGVLPVRCVLGEEGIASLDDAVDACSLGGAAPSPIGHCKVPVTSADDIVSESAGNGQAGSLEALDDALQDLEDTLQANRPHASRDLLSNSAGYPSKTVFCRSALDDPWGDGVARGCLPPPSKELARSPLFRNSFREALDPVEAPFSLDFCGEPLDGPAGSPETDNLKDCVPQSSTRELPRSPASKDSFRDAAYQAPFTTEHEGDSSSLEATPERSTFDKATLAEIEYFSSLDAASKPSEHISNASEEETDTMNGSSAMDVQQSEDEKAIALFQLFCTEGRDSRVWRKNDFRLINIYVLPSMFGPTARINWAHPHVALDQLERLVCGPRVPGSLQERPRRLHGRQPSQQMAMQERSRFMHQTARSMPSSPLTESKPAAACPEPSKLAASASHASYRKKDLDERRRAELELRRPSPPPSPPLHSLASSGPCLATQSELRHTIDISRGNSDVCAANLEHKVSQAASAEADVKRWLQELRQDLHREGGRAA